MLALLTSLRVLSLLCSHYGLHYDPAIPVLCTQRIAPLCRGRDQLVLLSFLLVPLRLLVVLSALVPVPSRRPLVGFPALGGLALLLRSGFLALRFAPPLACLCLFALLRLSVAPLSSLGLGSLRALGSVVAVVCAGGRRACASSSACLFLVAVSWSSRRSLSIEACTFIRSGF